MGFFGTEIAIIGRQTKPAGNDRGRETEREKKYFAKAIEAGLMEKKDDKNNVENAFFYRSFQNENENGTTPLERHWNENEVERTVPTVFNGTRTRNVLQL